MNGILILGFLVSFLEAAPEASVHPLQKLKSVQESTGIEADREYLKISGEILEAWNATGTDDKAGNAHQFVLIHFERAKRLAASGNFEAAASELKAEAMMQKQYGFRLEYSTKSPDRFFPDLVELQARVTTETGGDPLAGIVDYVFKKEADGFTAIRWEPGDDLVGITVPGVGAGEKLASVYRIEKRGDSFVAAPPRWFVAPAGELASVLERATREVAFESGGTMTAKPLAAQPPEKDGR